VLDVIRWPKMFATDHRGPNEGLPLLDRWTVDLPGGKVIQERLDDRGQEFPRIDPRLTGRRHRYGYTAGSLDDDPTDFNTSRTRVVKHDLEAQAVYQAKRDRSDLMLLDAESMETLAAVHLPARVPHGFHGDWMPTPVA
jgi:carotenoid cleavage dioxygenase